MDVRQTLKRPLLASAFVIVAVAGLLGAAPLAMAQPAPPGWVGEHYYHGGQHWHHRAWAYDRHHHRYYRYY